MIKITSPAPRATARVALDTRCCFADSERGELDARSGRVGGDAIIEVISS